METNQICGHVVLPAPGTWASVCMGLGRHGGPCVLHPREVWGQHRAGVRPEHWGAKGTAGQPCCAWDAPAPVCGANLSSQPPTQQLRNSD